MIGLIGKQGKRQLIRLCPSFDRFMKIVKNGGAYI